MRTEWVCKPNHETDQIMKDVHSRKYIFIIYKGKMYILETSSMGEDV